MIPTTRYVPIDTEPADGLFLGTAAHEADDFSPGVVDLIPERISEQRWTLNGEDELLVSTPDKVPCPSHQHHLTPLRAFMVWALLTTICVLLLLSADFRKSGRMEASANVRPAPNLLNKSAMADVSISQDAGQNGVDMSAFALLSRAEQQEQELEKLRAGLDLAPLLHAAVQASQTELDNVEVSMREIDDMRRLARQLLISMMDAQKKVEDEISKLDVRLQHSLTQDTSLVATKLWARKHQLQSKLLPLVQAIARLQSHMDALARVQTQLASEQVGVLQYVASKHHWVGEVARQLGAWLLQEGAKHYEVGDSAVQVAESTWQQSLQLRHFYHLGKGVDDLAMNATSFLELTWKKLEAIRHNSSVLLREALPLALDWSESLAVQQLAEAQEKLLKCQQHLAIRLEVPDMAATIGAEIQQRSLVVQGAHSKVKEVGEKLQLQEGRLRRQLGELNQVLHQWTGALHAVAHVENLREQLAAGHVQHQRGLQQLIEAANLVRDVQTREKVMADSQQWESELHTLDAMAVPLAVSSRLQRPGEVGKCGTLMARVCQGSSMLLGCM